MALPKPKKGETQTGFVSRCIGNAAAVKSLPDQKQRVAACYTTWEDSKKKSKGTITSIRGEEVLIDPPKE